MHSYRSGPSQRVLLSPSQRRVGVDQWLTETGFIQKYPLLYFCFRVILTSESARVG